MRSQGRALVSVTGVLIKRRDTDAYAHREHKDMMVIRTGEMPQMEPICRHPGSRTVRHKLPLLKPPGLWSFVMAAQADEHREPVLTAAPGKGDA